MTTNAITLTVEILECCVTNNILINVSLDGAEATHDRYRIDLNGYPTYRKIISNLMFIKRNYKSYFENCITLTMCSCTTVFSRRSSRFIRAFISGSYIKLFHIPFYY